MAETDPRLAEALQQTQRFISALEDDKHRASNESFTGTDEAETVKVTVNGDRRLTGLHIQQGLLRLGAPTVRQRINEALQNAHAAALAVAEEQQQHLGESLDAIVASLQQQLGGLQQHPR